jgi:hypothetical protein
MKRASCWIFGAFLTAIILASCGGGDSATNPNQPPVAGNTATPTAAATATPRPAAATATPVPTVRPPDEDANPGPVVTVFTRVFVVREQQAGAQIPGRYGDQYPSTPYYDPTTDREMVPLGSFFILDTTPKNAAGQKCQSDRVPEWVVDHGGKFEPLANNGIGTNPFQYRANARQKGIVQVYTFVDGVRSNVISVQIY